MFEKTLFFIYYGIMQVLENVSTQLTYRRKLRCSTSVLVFGCWVMNHVIYLKLREKQLLLQVNLCQKLLFLHQFNPQCIWQKIVHWLTSSVHENSKLRTCYVHKLFFFVLTFRTIHVHNMLWVCNFHVLNWYFNSVVIFWVHWSKNKSLWQIFTCNEKINTCLETFILDVSISDYWEEQWNKSKQLFDVIVDDP